MANPYRLLGVSRDSTAQQIEEAYLRLLRHARTPRADREPDALSIALAYGLLSDPISRARIDEAIRRRRPHPLGRAKEPAADRPDRRKASPDGAGSTLRSVYSKIRGFLPFI